MTLNSAEVYEICMIASYWLYATYDDEGKRVFAQADLNRPWFGLARLRTVTLARASQGIRLVRKKIVRIWNPEAAERLLKQHGSYDDTYVRGVAGAADRIPEFQEFVRALNQSRHFRYTGRGVSYKEPNEHLDLQPNTWWEKEFDISQAVLIAVQSPDAPKTASLKDCEKWFQSVGWEPDAFGIWVSRREAEDVRRDVLWSGLQEKKLVAGPISNKSKHSSLDITRATNPTPVPVSTTSAQSHSSSLQAVSEASGNTNPSSNAVQQITKEAIGESAEEARQNTLQDTL